jgi:hypothetical protein
MRGVGFDFNGVVDTGRFVPLEDEVIITGNTIPMVPGVLNWLKEHGINCAVYFQPRDYGANNMVVSGMWKAEMIKKLGLTKFYEDDPTQYNIIVNFCPECEVVKV